MIGMNIGTKHNKSIFAIKISIGISNRSGCGVDFGNRVKLILIFDSTISAGQFFPAARTGHIEYICLKSCPPATAMSAEGVTE
jgi:hypothetical protein